MRTRFKICCMSGEDEVRAAIDAGADALGFVSHMPSGAGIISEDLIAKLIPLVPPPVATFLLTCQTTSAGVIAQVRKCGPSTVQLCDSVSASVRADIRTVLPVVRIVQVIHVVGPESVEE